MRIFITGASGYLGARLSKFLAEQGNQVFALCFSAVPEDSSWTKAMEEVIVGDVRDEVLMASMAQKKMDAVIHLVSLDQPTSNRSPMPFVESVNVAPTESLLKIFSKHGLEQFIYFSTVHVYGAQEKLGREIITEDRKPDPQNAYALTHRMSEEICERYAATSDTRCTIVRLSNSYGSPVLPNESAWGIVVNSLCRGAFLNEKIELAGDGSPMRDFIHGDDVCDAIGILLNQSTISAGVPDVFNISSGKTFAILEIAAIIKEEYEKRYGKSLPVVTPSGRCEKFDLFADRPRYVISNEKLAKFGFSPRRDFRAGVNDLFSYLEKNG